MENKFEYGEQVYLAVTVNDVGPGGGYDYNVAWKDHVDRAACMTSVGEEQLFTAQEIADQCSKDPIDWQATYNEYSEKAQRTIAGLSKRITELDETIKACTESENIVRTNFYAKVDENKELKTRNAELESLLKEVMATRDEAIRQNDELITENKKLKADCNEWKDTANERLNAVQTLSAERNKVMAGVDELKNTLVDRTKDVQHLTEENDKLKTELDQRNKDFWAMKKDRDELDSIGGKLRAENENLKAWYEEANKTATEAAEANDELKAKIADLRNRVGEQLAQIQDLNAEIHFHKEFGEGLDKQQKELQARYDELDSVNKEQAEKIRKLDKALTDLKQMNDKLRDENTNLTFLLEDQPEKETTKTLHVVLNDGTEIEFRRYTAYDYRTDIKMFVVKDGERFIAGFNRGDKSFNFAYWWTE